MTLDELQKRCFKQADEKGWHETPITQTDMVALIHSEASEMLESFRNGEALSWTDDNNKPQGFASELADVVIRCGHYAEYCGINLDYEVTRKLDYNLTRKHRHGGKKA